VNPSESTWDWMVRIGTPEKFEERKRLRLEGKLNAPIHRKSVSIPGMEKHSLFCRCEACIPPEVQKWLEDRKGRPQPTEEPELEEAPVTAKPKSRAVVTSKYPKGKEPKQKGFKSPSKKWDSQNRGRSTN
jgi:hypothetical protein